MRIAIRKSCRVYERAGGQHQETAQEPALGAILCAGQTPTDERSDESERNRYRCSHHEANRAFKSDTEQANSHRPEHDPSHRAGFSPGRGGPFQEHICGDCSRDERRDQEHEDAVRVKNRYSQADQGKRRQFTAGHGKAAGSEVQRGWLGDC